MTQQRIADALEEIATLLELTGENPFKIRAYSNAARLLRGHEGDLGRFVEQARAGEIKGIGEALSAKIETLYKEGALPLLDKLRAETGPELLELLKVPGLGPKKIRTLRERLGINSIGALEYACLENRLLELPGFGPKSQGNVLEGIARVRRFEGRFLFPQARAAARELLKDLAATGLAARLELAGSLRRRLETVKDLDLLAASERPAELTAAFAALPQVEQVTGQGETKCSVLLGRGLAADLRVVAPPQFAAALAHFTGSKEHNAALRGRARRLGLKLNEYGLFEGERALEFADEAGLYRALGLHYIPPEAREGLGEIELAEQGEFPRLIQAADLRGVLHCHTTWSDGADSLADMARAAAQRGWQYLGVSEHSRSAGYAGGLSPDQIKQQRAEIERLNVELAPLRILQGIESDILADGALDYGDELLGSLDFVIASIHSQFNMDERRMTERIIAALANPRVTMLGHPTGRLLLSRDPYPVDMDAVLRAAAEHGKAIELNANPHRLDLDWRLHRRAVELGVAIAICPDAHSIDGLDDVEYGAAAARKGWLEPRDVLNCLELPRLLRALGARG